jgi:ectoine hydroxylase-related dioxygenase (phytanoyl-CoA dioxygenase family)
MSEAGAVADKARLYACIKKKSTDMAIANETDRTKNVIIESRLVFARIDNLVICRDFGHLFRSSSDMKTETMECVITCLQSSLMASKMRAQEAL